jgi:hypothetical protein
MNNWTNSKGQTVTETPTGLMVTNPDGTPAFRRPPVQVQQVAPKGAGLEAEVRRELSKPENKGVLVYVDEARGVTREFMAPVPPTVPARALSPLERMGQKK